MGLGIIKTIQNGPKNSCRPGIAKKIYEDVPFTPLRKQLTESRVGLVTTAEKPKPPGTVSLGILIQQELYAEPSNPPPQRFSTDILSWDKEATHTKYVNSFLPINRLTDYVSSGHIGSASARFHGVPTDYSKKTSIITGTDSTFAGASNWGNNDLPHLPDQCTTRIVLNVQSFRLIQSTRNAMIN